VGLKARGYMDGGELVPDEVILELVDERLAQPDCAGGFILDGFPRTAPQAEGLERILSGRDWGLSRVLEIALDDETIIERLSARQSCPECGRIYNSKSQPSAVAGICDVDGAKLYQRDDDRPETIRKRLSVYREQTRPVEEFFKASGLLARVDGSSTQAEIAGEIEAVLGPKPSRPIE
jgi:adenylate kinase